MSDFELGKVFGKLKPKLKHRAAQELLLPYSTIGMEFEFEKVEAFSHEDSTILNTYFTVKKDDSLHDMGQEFVFTDPIYGEDVIEAVKLICSKARTNRWASTLRTGIHVHLDIRDMSIPQLRGLLTYYAIFEPLIYAWVGEDRCANNFCAPWYKCEGSIRDASNLVRMLDGIKEPSDYQEELIVATAHYHKYAGLNLKPMQSLGSIEFRQLKTTTDTARVLQWINIIFALKKAALDTPTSSMAIITEVAQRQGDSISASINSIFGDVLKTTVTPEIIGDILKIGIPNAVEFLTEAMALSEFKSTAVVNGKACNHPGADLWLKAVDAPKKDEPLKKKAKATFANDAVEVQDRFDRALNNFIATRAQTRVEIPIPRPPPIQYAALEPGWIDDPMTGGPADTRLTPEDYFNDEEA